MYRNFLRSKIHRVTVTQTDLEYEGSLTVDVDLLEAAGIEIHEQVDVYNITRGTRFTTYTIAGERGSGKLCVNGAAAHLAEVGDLVIVVTYCSLDEKELSTHHPKVVLVDNNNKLLQ